MLSASLSARGLPLGESASTELAGRALAAAIAPVLTNTSLTLVAGVSFFKNHLDQVIASEFLRERPSLGLGSPHQWRLDREGNFRAEPDGLLERAQRSIATIGVARIIGLAHAANQHMEPTPVAKRRGIDEEEKIAARYEGGGKAGGKHHNLRVARERRIAHPAEARHVQQMVWSEPLVPSREPPRHLLAHVHAALKLDTMPLAIVEADGLDPWVAAQGISKANARVLAPRKQH